MKVRNYCTKYTYMLLS